MRDEILYVENLTTALPSQQNIDHVSFLLERGKVLGVTGLHGSGLSTLAAALCGNARVRSGTIYLDGQPAVFHSRADANHLGIFEIRHSLATIPTLSVSENLMVLHRFAWRDFFIRKRSNLNTTRAVFERYGIGGSPEGSPSGLTKGQQTQMSICRAMLCGARVLVCQEIGEGFSPEELAEFHQFLRQICQEGMAVILVNSDARKVLRFADHVAVMRDGIFCYFREAGEASLDKLSRCMAVEQPPEASVGTERRRKLLSFQEVYLPKFGGRFITTDIYTGVITGLYWQSCTHGDLISQMFTGRQKGMGTVTENGVSLPFSQWLQRNRRQTLCFGIRFWERLLNTNLTVAENLLLRTYYRYNDRLGILNRSMLSLALQEFSSAHGIDPSCFWKHPRTLPPELRNQIVLWGVLFSPPKLLVLDCPMYGMDEQIRQSFLVCLKKLKAAGTAILWSDNSETLRNYSDQFVVLDVKTPPGI